MFLVSQLNEFFIIAIVAIFIIATALLIYFIVTDKKKKDEIQITPNFEAKNENNITYETQANTSNQVLENNIAEQNNFEEIVPESLNEEEINNQKAIEDEKTDSNIATLLNQMQQDLEKANLNSYEESINRYEDEEEENAIISYTELMKYKEARDKNIILEDKNKDEIKEVIKEKEQKTEENEGIKKFKRSEFISPIFGYNDETNVTYREIKRPPRKEVKLPDSEKEWESDRILRDLEDNSAEVMEFEEKKEEQQKVDKNSSFLEALVDFRNKLN